MPERQVALLRGVNVVGRHVVRMGALAELFLSLGCSEIRTYIQSGNVLYTPPAAGLAAAALASVLEAQFGFPIPVILRTASELRLTIAANPFAVAGVDTKELHAVFLDTAPAITSLPLLAAAAAPGERFAVGERVLYLQLPSGVARSKLALVPGKPKFGAIGTMRNWATTLRLAAMLDGLNPSAPSGCAAPAAAARSQASARPPSDRSPWRSSGTR